jgi:hypothetical protein
MSSNSSPRLPKPELPKLRCARKVDFSTTLHSIGISDFAISRILMQRFRDFTPRNPEMVNEIDFLVDSAPPVHPADSMAHTILSALRDFALHDFASPDAKILGLQLTKPRNRNPRVNPTAPVGLNLRLYSPELEPLENTRRNSPAPP